MTISSARGTFAFWPLFFILSACWCTLTPLNAQVFRQGKGISNINVQPVSQQDLLDVSEVVRVGNINNAEAAKALKDKSLNDENFKKLRSRLPESLVTDSTEILNFVQRNIFKDTYVYGSQIFEQGSLDFAPVIRLANSPDYILGPGDQFEVSITGLQSLVNSVTVDNEGAITLPFVGRIYVRGLKFQNFESKLRSKFIESGFKTLGTGQSKFSLVLSNVRSIKVHVVGAKKPGTYEVPSIASTMHLLYQAGGPADLNSYRSIQLIRKGAIVETIDLYQFLSTGTYANSALLQDDDVIFIPPYECRVNLVGEFQIPGLFELKNGESLSDLLQIAHGFTEGAFKELLLAFRVGTEELEVCDIPSAQYGTFYPRSGDVLVANPVRNRYANRVAVTGGVRRPGYYEFTEGLTSQELLDKALGLDPTSDLRKSVLFRKPLGKLGSYELLSTLHEAVKLQPNDSIYVPLFTELQEMDYVYIFGSVIKPQTIEFRPGLTVEQAVVMSGGIEPMANTKFVELSEPILDEQGFFTGKYQLKTVALNFEENASGTPITKGSTITLRLRPNVDSYANVLISGAFATPGQYSLTERGEFLSTFLERNGRFRPNGLTKFAVLKRPITGETQFEPDLYKRIVSEDLTITYEPVKRELKKSETYALDLTKRRRVKGVQLYDGDELFIPSSQNTVYVQGAVKRETGVVFRSGKRAWYYVQQAGGYSQNARKASLAITYANGITKTPSNILGIKVYPKIYSNTTIRVDEYLDSAKESRRKLSIEQLTAIASILTSTASLVFSTVILLQ